MHCCRQLSAGVHRERKSFDRQVNVLQHNNPSRDDTLLENYALWTPQYLSHQMDGQPDINSAVSGTGSISRTISSGCTIVIPDGYPLSSGSYCPQNARRE